MTQVKGNFTAWHDYAVDWAPDHVTFYVDGNQVLQTSNPAAIPKTPMHLCIQEDVGPIAGDLPAPDPGQGPVTMHVAWSKTYS
jgi:beta-glucanase (GH16 family)